MFSSIKNVRWADQTVMLFCLLLVLIWSGTATGSGIFAILTVNVIGNGVTEPPLNSGGQVDIFQHEGLSDIRIEPDENNLFWITAFPDSGWAFDHWFGDVGDPDSALTFVDINYNWLPKTTVIFTRIGSDEPTALIAKPLFDTSQQQGLNIIFQGYVTKGSAPFTYKWDFGGNVPDATVKDPGSIPFETAGIYLVRFTVTDSLGKTSSDTVQVTIIGNGNDACPQDPGKTAPGVCGCGVPDLDTDEDDIADCVDTDDDNDGVPDTEDAFPLDETEALDTDLDTIGNNADDDDDNDGISDAIENAGPGDGDCNNDSVQDNLQSNVACMNTYTAQGYIILESPDGTALTGCQILENPSLDDSPTDIEYPFGFIGFTVTGLQFGGNTNVTLTLPHGVVADTYYKYGQTPENPTDHWYEFLYDNETGAEINDNVITLNFIDALRGDDELIQDSMVEDLGAPCFSITAIDTEPTAIITSPASNATTSEGGTINFQGMATEGNSPYTYAWNFGGGAANVSTQSPGSVTFPTAGTYTVTFTVTDVDNDNDSDSVTITVTANDDNDYNDNDGGDDGKGGCFIDSLSY